MASSPITSWQIDGETMETVTDFIFLGSKITADGECSHEIKRCLPLGRKTMTNLDSTLKNRRYFANKGLSSQSYGFFPSSHVWMWESDHKESWALKNWCFWSVVSKSLRVPWTTGRSNQSILKEISPGTVATWCRKVTHQKRPWCWEILMAGGQWDDRVWDGWMASPTWWTWVWESSKSWWCTGKPGVLQSMGVAKSQTWLSNWTKLNSQDRSSDNSIHRFLDLVIQDRELTIKKWP